MMAIHRNPVLMSIAGILAALFVVILLACGCLSAQRAAPANPQGMQARTAAIEQMNAQIRGGR